MKNKGNDGTGDNADRDSWQTKQELFDLLNSQYNFEFDCCASFSNKKTVLFSDNFELVDKIDKVSWMNPPFSKAFNMFTHFFKVINKGVAIYRIDNPETKIWQEVIFPNASWIFIPKGRISYTPFEVGNMREGNGTRFPSALIGLNVEPPKNITGIIIKIVGGNK